MPVPPELPHQATQATAPTPTSEGQPRVRVLAWLGLLGVGEFVLAVLALHAVLRGEPQHLSEYATSPYRHVWLAAASSFALASLALTFAMRHCLSGSSLAARLGTGLMGLGAVGACLLAAFPVDANPGISSLAEEVHMGAAWPAFGASAAAMLVLVPDLRNRPAWRRFALVSLVLGVLTAVSAFAYVVTDIRQLPVAAVVQRVMASCIALWLGILAVHLLDLHRQARRPAVRPPVARRAPFDLSAAHLAPIAPSPATSRFPENPAWHAGEPAATVAAALPLPAPATGLRDARGRCRAGAAGAAGARPPMGARPEGRQPPSRGRPRAAIAGAALAGAGLARPARMPPALVSSARPRRRLARRTTRALVGPANAA